MILIRPFYLYQIISFLFISKIQQIIKRRVKSVRVVNKIITSGVRLGTHLQRHERNKYPFKLNKNVVSYCNKPLTARIDNESLPLLPVLTFSLFIFWDRGNFVKRI